MKHCLRFAFASLLISSALFSGCGRDKGGAGTEPTRPPEPVSGGTKATLVVFGAPWCPDCKVKFPELRNRLAVLSAARLAGLKIKVIVPTGEIATSPPDLATAQSYRDQYFPGADVELDSYPRWKAFREFFPGKGQALPAGVVIPASGDTLKFPPGATSFSPASIFSKIEGLL